MNESELRSSILTLEADMKRILFILDNDTGSGRSGLISEFDKMKKELQSIKDDLREIKVESKMSKLIWASSGGLLGGALIKFGTLLFG